MKTSVAMQSLIMEIAERHHFDLDQKGTTLTLEMDGFMPLCIERINKNQIGIYHYFIQNGDVFFDPEVVFFTGMEPWVAMSIRYPFSHHHVYAVPNSTDIGVSHLNTPDQAKLASFCIMWAEYLRAQGWVTKAKGWV